MRTIETNVHGTEIVLQARQQEGQARRDLLDVRGLRQEHGRAVPRGRRPGDGPDAEAPLGVRVQQGDRRVPGAGLPPRAQAAGDRRPAVQHGRAAADRPLRHGDPELRAAGARRRADHGARRRHADAIVHLRRRRRRRPARARGTSRAPIGQVFNIGNNEEISILRRSPSASARRAGSRRRSCCIPYDEAYEAGFEDMPRRVPDLRKIQDLVGYAPTLALDDILRARHRRTRARSLAAGASSDNRSTCL